MYTVRRTGLNDPGTAAVRKRRVEEWRHFNRRVAGPFLRIAVHLNQNWLGVRSSSAFTSGHFLFFISNVQFWTLHYQALSRGHHKKVGGLTSRCQCRRSMPHCRHWNNRPGPNRRLWARSVCWRWLQRCCHCCRCCLCLCWSVRVSVVVCVCVGQWGSVLLFVLVLVS